jgi:hypothetical protein
MKSRSLVLLLIAGLAFAGTARAALFYSGVQNIPVPVTLDGAYLRITDGTAVGSFPADWNLAPWINPFFGGTEIANSALLRPVITGADRILNLAVGTPINATSNFVAGESGSTTHVGPAANQFQLGSPGIIGFAFKPSVSDPDFYGWLRLTINNVGTGSIVDWGYQTTAGAGVTAGAIGPIPEAGTALFATGVVLACLTRRIRPRR